MAGFLVGGASWLVLSGWSAVFEYGCYFGRPGFEIGS